MAPLAIDEDFPAIQNGVPDLNGHVDNKRRDLTNGLSKMTSSSMAPDAATPVLESATTCSLGNLQTEQENANTSNIDAMSSLDLCRKVYCIERKKMI